MTTDTLLTESIRKEQIQRNILSHENPLMYRGYLIYHNGGGWGGKFEFIHKDYDGEEDSRFGHGESVEHCVEQINDQIEMFIEQAVEKGAKFMRVNSEDETDLRDLLREKYLSAWDGFRLSTLEVSEKYTCKGKYGQTITITRTR